MSYLGLLPALLMALFGCAALLIDVAVRANESRAWQLWLTLGGEGFIAYAFYRQWLNGSVDGLSLFANGLVWLAAVGLFLMSYRYLDIVHEHHAEYYALALFAQCGMYFMAAATDLVLLFTGIELTAICFYILVGFTRADRRSNEAALKYLLLGALSSAFLLYGFSLLYGLTGSTGIAEAITALQKPDPFAVVAGATILIGLGLKVSAAPFHNWAPDAYDGAPTPITGYLSVASSIAAFAVILRLFPIGTASGMLTVAAVLSLTVGSIAAITQERLKRLFAYSGIAHAGYVLLGFVAGTREGIFIYLLVYALMNLGAFAVLVALRREGVSGEDTTSLRGLSQTHPAHAAMFTVLLLSLAGVPPTAGFIGKYYIFAALIRTGHIWLAVIASCYVVVSLYFYFRLIREMYLEQGVATSGLASSIGIRIALTVTATLTLLGGVFPETLLQPAVWLSGVAP